MKNSGVEWIGEIPDEWEVKKLKYICDPLASGGTPDSNNDQYYQKLNLPKHEITPDAIHFQQK